jgi:hypothetical protein
MKTLLATLFIAATATSAFAGGQAGTVGVGAEYDLSGLGGVSVNFDGGKFHVGGFFGYSDPANGYVWDLGGRFYYHLHSTAMADFGIGGGLGIESVPPPGANGRRTTDLYLEPSFQIRLFVASNVALSFTAGISIGLADAPDDFVIGGQAIGPVGAAGIHYYFF